MSTNKTTGLGLTLTPEANYGEITFGEWVQIVNGDSDSNMQIIDDFALSTNSSLLTLQNSITDINSNLSTLNATVSNISGINSINGEAVDNGDVDLEFSILNGNLILAIN